MKLLHLSFIGLFAVALTACSTPGRNYEDNKVALITKGSTTEAQLVEWFGPPDSRAWKFAPGKTGGSQSGKLDVRLDPDGKVTAYNSSAPTN
jgi:hypothetical protein